MAERVKIIRFGILHNQPRLAAWEQAALRTVLALGNTALAVQICLAGAPAAAASTASFGARYVLWRSYLHWLYRPLSLRRAGPPAALPPAVPLLACAGQHQAGEWQLVEPAALASLRAYKLDFILSFASAPVGGALLTIPRLGVWAFRFGAGPSWPGQPLGLREVYQGEPTTTAELYQRPGGGPQAAEAVLRRGVFSTQWHSPTATATSIYAECAHWPAESCRRLTAGGELASALPPLAPATAPKAWPPPNGALLALVARLAKYKLRSLYHTFLRADQWNIGVVERPIQELLRPGALQGVAVDSPPLPNRHVFYADCFARPEATGPAVYFELYDYRTRRGNISRLSYPWAPGCAPSLVLDFPFHLSYPFLHGPYCLPEAWVTNGIRLYDLRAPVADPGAGQLLLAVPGVDATLLEHQGRYWLFYTRADRDPMLNLYIAYADALAGPWHEHAQNPVKTDVRSARPAGPFFEAAGRLYRPAQDCARDYGHGITLNEVLTLTPTAYAEREVITLTSPHPDYPAGMHTIAALDATRTLIDFKRHRFIPFAMLSALWRPLSSWLYGPQGRRKPPVIAPPPAKAEH